MDLNRQAAAACSSSGRIIDCSSWQLELHHLWIDAASSKLGSSALYTGCFINYY
jgi:hypothetical protein